MQRIGDVMQALPSPRRIKASVTTFVGILKHFFDTRHISLLTALHRPRVLWTVRDGTLSGTERMAARTTKSQGIVSWPQEERPRERLLSRGAQALTDAELVAILVRVGFKGTSAVELGRQLLKRFGSLRAMVEAPVIALLEVKGLKGAKAAQLLGAMEIARRVAGA